MPADPCASERTTFNKAAQAVADAEFDVWVAVNDLKAAILAGGAANVKLVGCVMGIDPTNPRTIPRAANCAMEQQLTDAAAKLRITTAKAKYDRSIAKRNKVREEFTRAQTALTRCKKTKKPKKEPPPPVGAWTGSIQCILHGSGSGRSGIYILNYHEIRFEHTWKISDEPQDPEDPTTYPVLWTVNIVGGLQHTQPGAGPRGVDWVCQETDSGDSELQSRITIAVDKNRYKVQIPAVRPNVAQDVWNMASICNGRHVEPGSPAPILEENVELTGRVEPGGRLITGTKGPIPIPSRTWTIAKWKKTLWWNLRLQ